MDGISVMNLPLPLNVHGASILLPVLWIHSRINLEMAFYLSAFQIYEAKIVVIIIG